MFYDNDSGMPLKALSQCLRPLGALYAWGASSNLKSKRNGPNAFRSEVPVISVGNYVVGGGGKTPMVLYLAKWLRAQNKKVAVLIRGYGAQAGVQKRVMGQLDFQTRQEVGDEATLIAETLMDVPVYVGKDRVAHAKIASSDADVILLDDGLQHAAIQRDWDVVCFKGPHPIGNGRCLPAGPLREPLPAQCPPQATWAHIISNTSEAWERSDLQFTMALHHISNLNQDKLAPNTPLHLVCGVARPLAVRQSIMSAGWQVMHMRALPDHGAIHQPDLAQWLQEAQRAGCALVMTEKDGARVDEKWPEMQHIHLLRAGLNPCNHEANEAFLADIARVAGV